ncbi:MAG: hypothetical protein JSW39_18675 [Desulfobacterales bacterium]|nr:MAG: hypothetical protein JSW39_18675 [Desulfobacterales bacterium]
MSSQTQSKVSRRSGFVPTANHAVERLFSSQRGFACQARRDPIQTKLKIGEPGDKYEREADRMADAVMRMPDPAIQLKPG